MKQQKLVVVQVDISGAAPAIVPVGGGTLDEILQDWRVVQIQPLSAPASPADHRYHALLLLEEAATDRGLGRLGFGVE